MAVPCGRVRMRICAIPTGSIAVVFPSFALCLGGRALILEYRIEETGEAVIQLRPPKRDATLSPFLADVYDACLPQHLEVVRGGGLRHRQIDTSARSFSLERELSNDLQTYGIGKCIKH